MTSEQPITVMRTEKDLVRIDHQRVDNRNLFVVNWCLGNTCNFECSYCPDGLHDGSVRWPDIEIVKSFIALVKKSRPNQGLFFEFTGGEVTMYKHFEELLGFCSSLGIKVGIISNGSRTLRWWKEYGHLLDHLCLSYHPEYADQEHYKKVAELMAPIASTHLNIMMPPDNFETCYTFAKECSSIPDITMALQPLIVDLKDALYDYSPRQQEVFKDQWSLTSNTPKTRLRNLYRGVMVKTYANGSATPTSAHQFISTQTNNWKGWKCLSGMEQIVVDMRGNVMRGWCGVGGVIGNISNPDLKLPTSPVVCDSSRCHCNFDIMSTKFK